MAYRVEHEVDSADLAYLTESLVDAGCTSDLVKAAFVGATKNKDATGAAWFLFCRCGGCSTVKKVRGIKPVSRVLV